MGCSVWGTLCLKLQLRMGNGGRFSAGGSCRFNSAFTDRAADLEGEREGSEVNLLLMHDLDQHDWIKIYNEVGPVLQ